jgi:acetoin utilization deacetylase AcuC-like enzyme
MQLCVLLQADAALHDLPGHPESQTRLEALAPGLRGVATTLHGGQPASVEQLARIHDPTYIEIVRARCAALEEHGAGHLDPDTYIRPRSFEVACSAAGLAVAAARRVLDGTSVFALVRPPGHHAERTHAMGFCLFNNIAIAAAEALDRGLRVAIVDWDLHHGNGTQHAFYRTDRVLYCSVHRRFHFPGTGWYDERGAGLGLGYTLNAPLPAGSAGADYRYLFESVFCPAVEAFGPDLVLVSAGQDALAGDPLGGMALAPSDFGMMTSLLREAVDLPLALVLEGGYGSGQDLALAAILNALRGDRMEPPQGMVRRETREVADYLKPGLADR